MIFETIKRYYPFDIQPFSKEYESSNEYKALIERVLYFQTNTQYEKAILNKLEGALPPHIEISNITRLDFLDRCFTFCLGKRGRETEMKFSEIIICVSILGAYYCIYERKTDQIKDISGDIIGFTQDFLPSINHNEFSTELVEDLKKTASSFNLVEVTSSNLIQLCPGYAFFGISKEDFTLFNGLFKDEY